MEKLPTCRQSLSVEKFVRETEIYVLWTSIPNFNGPYIFNLKQESSSDNFTFLLKF